MVKLYKKMMDSKTQKDLIDRCVYELIACGCVKAQELRGPMRLRLAQQVPKGTNWDRLLDASLRRLKKAGKIRYQCRTDIDRNRTRRSQCSWLVNEEAK